LKEISHIFSILRVLTSYIGANSYADLSFLLRHNDESTLGKIEKADWEHGLQRLEACFRISRKDLQDLNTYSTFQLYVIRSVWVETRAKYLRLAQTHAERRKGSVTSQSMEVEPPKSDTTPQGSGTGKTN